jgi:hydrogenase maturation protein HypF
VSHDETPASGIVRVRVKIQGAVQGVGFRPFIYRLATELSLVGWVINDSRGVFIEVDGLAPGLKEFLERIERERPPRSLINSLEVEWLPAAKFERFEIRHSQAQGAKTVLVLPDIATCSDCLEEVLTPTDRRFGYPFTNCTNCGPRFTIIRALPYDRPNTSMAQFHMCPRCQREYEDPLDRRFHAQPNACPECGPQLFLLDGQGDLLAEGDDALQQAADAVRRGDILALKGMGGFQLMVDARNSQAVAELRRRKQREEKPLALMARDLSHAEALVQMTSEAARLLDSPEAPILLLPKQPKTVVVDNVAPGNPSLGVMLPYTPLHHLLMRELDGPVVATSGNLSDEPICIDESEAVNRLRGIADFFLAHNRPIVRHVDDSVAWMVNGELQMLRRARGFAPLPIMVDEALPTVLAVGAHLKNTVALSVGRHVFLSQHIGDLETAAAMSAFARVIHDFLSLYEAAPVAIAHDAHPDYLSTRWAAEQVDTGVINGEEDTLLSGEGKLSGLPLIPVQHHHAHLAACLADAGVKGPALGVTWDGTGYGTDGTVWGGEFLLGDAARFDRVAHLRAFRLPGGDAAVREPRRTAVSLLWEVFGDEVFAWDDVVPVRDFSSQDRRILGRMLQQGVNSPLTTSAGRLFDGIAALAGFHLRVSYEGQAAMALEYAAGTERAAGAYPLPLVEQTTDGMMTFVLDWHPLVRAVLDDLRRRSPVSIISARFHNALAQSILGVAQRVGVERVALTGGCFQNRRLTESLCEQLEQAGFQPLVHRQVPPNDGSISLGQILVAAAKLRRD